MLRTSFCWDLGERMVQIVHRRTEPALRLLDWRHLAEDQYEQALQAELEAELRQGFDMAKEVPFRLRLILLDADQQAGTFRGQSLPDSTWPSLLRCR